MGPGDDFRAFLQTAVPDHLRRRALRRLWVSNPVLANLDGLNDYDGDFTGGSVAQGMLKTAYQVGRGIVKQAADVAELQDKVQATSFDSTAEATPEAAEDREGAEPQDQARNTAENEVETVPTPRRKMRFTFDG